MIERREEQRYPGDEGDGFSISRDGDKLRVGMTWDGAERAVGFVTFAEIRDVMEGPSDAAATHEWQLIGYEEPEFGVAS